MVTLLTLFVIAGAIAVAPTPASADAQEKVPHTARVRAADARTATLLVQGLERSVTIRRLVNQLEQHDVIVYIETQPSLKKRLAGTLTWVTATQNHRYVRVSISPDLSTDTAIATLGHELQHAFEVAKAPMIVDEQTLLAYYQFHGDGSRLMVNGWDTEAARVAGDDVRRELALARNGDKSRANRVTDSIQQFDPDDWLVVYRRARGMLPP